MSASSGMSVEMTSGTTSRKRDRVELIHDILRVIQEAGGHTKPTHLLYKANLSHEALKRYVKELMDGGMLVEQEKAGRKGYALTDKGYEFLAQYRKFREFSDAFGI